MTSEPQGRAFRAVVRGRVQGVGFRDFVRREALALGLKGWVRNGDDGTTVELFAEGEAEALSALRERLGRGPDGARVDAVEVKSAEPSGSADFEVRF